MSESSAQRPRPLLLCLDDSLIRLPGKGILMIGRSILSISATLAAISVIVAGLLVSYLRSSDEGLEKQPSSPMRSLVAASEDPSIRVVYPISPAGSARQISPLSQNEPSK